MHYMFYMHLYFARNKHSRNKKHKYTARESNTMLAATLRIHIAIGMI